MDQRPREPNAAGKGVLGAGAPRTESLPSAQLFAHRLLPARLSQCRGGAAEVVLGSPRGSLTSFLALLRSPTAGLRPSPRPPATQGPVSARSHLPRAALLARVRLLRGVERWALTRGGPDPWLGLGGWLWGAPEPGWIQALLPWGPRSSLTGGWTRTKSLDMGDGKGGRLDFFQQLPLYGYTAPRAAPPASAKSWDGCRKPRLRQGGPANPICTAGSSVWLVGWRRTQF